MKITFKRLIISLGLIIVVAFFTGTNNSYTADCINCLEQIRGKEFNILGLPVSHRYKFVKESHRTISVPLLPDIPLGSTDTLLEIIGTPCTHDFKRSGFGTSPLIGGFVGCGSFSEGNTFKLRRYALSALSALNQRVPNPELARTSYAMIETMLPSDRSNSYGEFLNEQTLSELSMMLNLTTSLEEWKETLAYFESPSTEPQPLIKNLKLLSERVKSEDPIVRQTSAITLIQLETGNPTNTLDMLLESSDPKIVAKATTSILANREMTLFGKMLRVQKRPINSFWRNQYTDNELEALFAYNDPVIDRFCFVAITERHRISMLPLVVECLNRRDTPHAQETVKTLIAGPNPLTQNGDAWKKLEPLSLPLEELREYLEIGTAPKQKDPRKWKFLNAVDSFASHASADDWDYLHETYLREVTRGVNETYGAVMARALMRLDMDRTIAFLLSELETEDHHRQTSAMAGMGLIADRNFEPVLLKFRASIPPRDQYRSQPRDAFNNPHYRQFLDYALHRSSGIHTSQLVQDSSGQYKIQKAP